MSRIVREPSERQRRIEHRESWELLPWLANDSLSEAQTQRLRTHIDECAECRREYQEQLLLRQELQREESVLHTPHASLRKLMTRIEADVTPFAESSRPAIPHVARRARWLTFTVAAQALGLVVLVGVLSWRSDADRREPRYSTLSSAPTTIPQGPAARVVFSPSLTLAQLGELLRSHNAQVAAGPSDAGVYTLVFPGTYSQQEVTAAVTQLRSNPEVRFAELAIADYGADSGAGN